MLLLYNYLYNREKKIYITKKIHFFIHILEYYFKNLKQLFHRFCNNYIQWIFICTKFNISCTRLKNNYSP